MTDLENVPLGGVLGIDPGSASGCLAYLSGPFIGTWPIGSLTDQELADLTLGLAKRARFVLIEQVGAMPKQGLSSTFKFGANYGALRALVAASGTRWALVLPARWQRALECLTKGDKRIARTKAQQVFPQHKVRAVEADALLIAAYGASLEFGRVFSLQALGARVDDLLGF